MKILIINQPTGNYGDLAAHRSLMRALSNISGDINIKVLFPEYKSISIEKMNVTKSEYIGLPAKGRRFHKLSKIYFAINYFFCFEKLIFKLWSWYPDLKKVIQEVKWADYVICAPGGICMGTFQNWRHIFYLKIAKIYGNYLAYYSRSWGPFPEKTFMQRVFKKSSIKLLHSFDFHSIRDSKTMKAADELGLSYIPSIDTAFLDQPRAQIPQEITSWIKDAPYTVIVPNELIWHRNYHTASKGNIKEFYLSIIRLLLKKDPNNKIIMLPQLYSQEKTTDEVYFQKIKDEVNDKRIFVVADKYDSDIQQTIISKAKLVIGARYHSIVFAVNNSIPFISLSYEHKMIGLLEILNKAECSIDITPFASNSFDSKKALTKIDFLIESVKPDPETREKAHLIALSCFYELKQSINRTNGSHEGKPHSSGQNRQ